MDVYVIHCEKHKERLPNIEHHLNKLFPQLKIWNGVVINNSVPFLEKEMKKYNTNITVKNNNIFKTIGEIGCYLSHHTLLKHIKETKTTAKYTLVLEDDGMFLKDVANLHDKLDKVDFDILYLGLNNENKHKHIVDTIYSIDKTKPLQGIHAYAVNNNKINKIYENTLTPIGPIDYQYEILIKEDTINGVIFFPYLCVQDRKSFHSTIKISNNNMRQRKNKKIVIQTPPLVYNYEQELRQRNLKNDTRIGNLINPPNDIKCVQSVKRENTTPRIRKRVKNRTLPKK
jgi:GR25 family glycosyltransferase involved in LPS biosynthesis